MLHQPVLLEECLAGLAIKPEGFYLDGTFGRGGHSQAILEKLSAQGHLLIIDKDLEAIKEAQKRFGTDPRVKICHGSFANLKQFCQENNCLGQISGILFDLGVSSPQLEEAERGFSFMQNGPLDMRMDLTQSLTAAAYINQARLQDMVQIFRELGEERFAKRIASAIIKAREVEPIMTTEKLAAIIKEANPKWEKHKHPATRVFQAIRLHINQELEDLQTGLKQAIQALTNGGRLVVISFHSLEDRIVKQFMRQQEEGEPYPHHIPLSAEQLVKTFKRVGKAIKPSCAEIERNIRSRSAVLRIGEKIA